MRFIITRLSVKEAVKHTTTQIEVVQHTNKGKCGSKAQELEQMRFISTRSSAKEAVKHTNNAN